MSLAWTYALVLSEDAHAIDGCLIEVELNNVSQKPVLCDTFLDASLSAT